MAKFNLRRDEKHVEKMFKDAMAEPTRYGKYLKSKLTDDQILELWKAMNIIKNASIEKLLTFDEAHGCITEEGDSWAWDLSGDFEDSLMEPYWEDEED
jgi:hypothetical protein